MIGECLCGGVRFEITGAAPNLYQCHCSQCRKQGGSASNTATIVSEWQFSWQRGESLISRFQDKTGFNSHFCSVCGCPVPNALGDKELVWVPAGLLDECESLEIVAHLFVSSKAQWETIGNSGIHYDEMPSLDALIKALK